MNPDQPLPKILLVDDKEANLLALEALLSNVEATCVKVTSGRQALKCLLEQEFALILLDVKMPEMDGFETAEIIRQREKNETTPIVFVTAYNPSETLMFKGYALGAVDYIVKPIIPEILISKVKVFIQLFQQNQRLKQEIEEHKRTQESLFLEKELAQVTLKSIGDAVITTNAQGKITYLNPMAEYLTGWSQKDAQGLPLLEILTTVNEITQIKVENPIIKALEQVKIVNLPQNTMLIARDGRKFAIDDSASPIQDIQGNIIGAVIVFRDITDYKRQEEAKLSNILDRAIAAIASYRAKSDRSWVFDYWSGGCERLFGYTAEELIADQNLWTNNVYPEDLAPLVAQIFEDHKLHRTNYVEYRFRHKDGTRRWIAASQFFAWDEINHCWLVTGVFTDITDRKQAEIALREAETIIKQQEEQLRLALELTQTGVWDWQLTTGIIQWNSCHYNLLGYQVGEVECTYEAWRSRLHPDDVTEVERQLLEALENHRDYKAEYRVIYSDGTIRWVLGKGQGLYDEAGQPVRMIGTIVDITDRKQAEIALQEQLNREQLVKSIAQNIRETLDLEQVLQRTVDQVRDFLKCDRVIIFRFQPDWSGIVIRESVNQNYPAIVDTSINDPCFAEDYIEPYRQGIVTSRTDFYAEDIPPCYRELMKPFQVRANLAVPILQADKLWGLLIAHQCSAPRQWQETEIELMKQLATQVGIAIQQSELYQQAYQELQQRKKAQESLFISEQRLKALLEYAPVLIFMIDLENRYFLVSRSYEDMIGMTAEQLLGKSLYDIWTKEEADFMANHNRQILASQQIMAMEQELLPPHTHKPLTFFTLKFPLYDATGKVYAIGGISTDITERKQAKSKIAEQAALIDLATDAIFVHDFDDQILFWSKGAERLYGWTAAEIIGQKSQSLFNQDIALTQAIQTARAEGSWQGEIEQITKTGQKIIVASHKTRVENKFSQPQSILVVNNDITEKKQLEQQFYHAQRLESLGTLASGIAHDFNNILTPILGASQLLPQKLPHPDDQTQRLLAILSSSARRGADLVKQILLFSRSTEGNLATIQLGYLLLELIGIAKQTFPKSITISHEIPTKELSTISADAIQMHQVFMNLMVNARDAMTEGGKLTISAENRQLDQYYAAMNLEAKVGAYVVVTVADTGSGISPDLLDKIFDPFFTTKGTGKGTGLGLSTVRGIVKNHGGFVKVHSELGKGTQFNVFLPAIAGEVNLTTSEEAMPSGNGELILIVEDEALIQEITKTALENYNYRTMIASDGIEALSLYAQHQQEISVVLMDMMLPNLDGLTAIRTLQKINPQVKIIATSGIMANQKLALEANVKTFLVKPYTTSKLLEALTEIMVKI
ncbi:PAS domain S-box protein [Planktothricoides sp. SR001]|uniref:PAS domain S-box protein n=1 Tax=Planktothricoides sp. SR001 TaxID=1705388 RepID=UPI0006C8708D|nr:PAS domain S-box protein [Planktothricoides sp. SR001]